MVAVVTSRPVSEYTPTTMRRSWISAAMAPTANFHWKRNVT